MQPGRVVTTLAFAVTSVMLVLPWPFVYVLGDVGLPYGFFVGVLGLALAFNLASGIPLVVAEGDERRQDWSVVTWVFFLVMAGALQLALYAMATLQPT